jgi:hypothetical protein
MDHWLIPQLSANHQGPYVVTKDNAAALIRLLRHIMETKGLTAYIADRDELWMSSLPKLLCALRSDSTSLIEFGSAQYGNDSFRIGGRGKQTTIS